MPKVITLIAIASLSTLTGCASLRGGPPSCDGASRRPVGTASPVGTSLIAPDAANAGGHDVQS